jgi:glycosyltransferase involved in cell wall biosynthesis
MAGWMAALDCLVLPSRTTPRWKEQFGRVLVEAMACEVAVVGSDSGEIPRVIGGGGVVFPEGDTAALGRGLEALAGSTELRRRLGAAGRARVLTTYTQEKIVADTLAFYQALVPRGVAPLPTPAWSPS